VDRLACLELPAFPLQLLLREHADWRGKPAAVLERDLPHGIVLWVNEEARALGVLSGQRYAAALGLCAELRAGVIDSATIERGVDELVLELQQFSPEVEPCADEPGVFWLGVRGLERLFGAPRAWAGQVRAHVRSLGFQGRIAVGFRHFAVYAAVKALPRTTVMTSSARSASRNDWSRASTALEDSSREANTSGDASRRVISRMPLDDFAHGIALFDDPSHEARVAAGVNLALLPIDPEAREALAKLAITSLGAFAKLPANGIRRRFGDSVHRLHRMASGAFDDELAPADELIPFMAHFDLEMPDASLDAVLVYAEKLARPLCDALAKSGEAAAAITLRLELDDRTAIEEHVIPARPTCDVDWLMRLLRMRLDARPLSSGVVRVAVTIARTSVTKAQAALFVEARRRSGAAAAKAFSALRAKFGDDAVACARLVSAHLPEHGFRWERCDEIRDARRASDVGELAPPLVRCLFATPLRLPPRGRHEPDGWLLRGVTHGSVVKLFGPYRLNGGWWRSEVKREYYFAELTGGEIAWIFYDVERRRWFLQGAVS
jgi:protein ImuB